MIEREGEGVRWRGRKGKEGKGEGGERPTREFVVVGEGYSV